MINSELIQGVRQVFLKAQYHAFNIIATCIYCYIMCKITDLRLFNFEKEIIYENIEK